MPWTSVFDEALLKKTVIMFRMLDNEWVTLTPHRSDYRSYRGSNYQTERFYGGKSLLFAVPETTLESTVDGVDVQIYVYKQVSKFFELRRQQNFGFVLVNVDTQLNGIIKDLRERKELDGYFSGDLDREPISRSTRGTFTLLDDRYQETEATIEVYMRISCLGRCIITELHAPMSIRKAFYAREESDDLYEYQFRELSTQDVESYHWGSRTILPPLHPDKLICRCHELEGPCDETTQTLKLDRKEKRKKSDYAARLEQMKKLLELMKEMRKNRPEIMGHGPGPKKICPIVETASPCPTIPMSCFVALSTVCPNPCQIPTVSCQPPPC
ncbi:hypothetical protein WN55_01398 [Dufourea novaeangliae]|uniref:Uncharacterized protein n=2 Tax=Dufourea novaeangliae TaxID=178035 RepID=A0A154PEJ2_DUFNO|nr:hypothetical protein WN55_01398 [Dufourea novaeangliae]